MAYVLQRAVEGVGKRENWFDAETFADRERGLAAVERERAFALARIQMAGGTSYTMQHPQLMRLIEVLS